MAKVSFVEIPTGYDLKYQQALNPAQRFTVPTVRRTVLFSSRRRKKGMTEKSLIPILKPVWNGYSDIVRASWTSAGAINKMTGFNLFLKDTALRIANGIAGYATPNDLYQALVGRIHVQAPASAVLLEQLHPLTYYVQKKVVGTKNQFEPSLVTEHFSLPLTIKISHKTALTGTSGFATARFYAIVYSHYQGLILETPLVIDFPLSADWAHSEATLSSVKGLVRGYTAFLEVFDARGDVWIDNVVLEHNGLNWARDPFCNDINQSFTKAFYQIPKNWAAGSLPVGAFFESIYYN